ncbi:MAG: sensor histidine kinase [Chloroflexota bacterium]
MTSARRLLIAAPVIVFATSWLWIPDTYTDALASATDAVTGWILVAAGLVTWSRRRESRTGPWLVLAGYLWYVGDLYFVFPTASIVPLLSFGLRGGYDILLAAALLSFPGGRLTSHLHRAAVAALAMAYAARAIAFFAVAIPGRWYPDNGTPNPFLMVHDRALAANLVLDLDLLKGAVILAVGLLAVARLRSDAVATRRVLRPVVAGGLAWAVMSFLLDFGAWLQGNFHLQLLPWANTDWWPIPEYLIRGSAAPIGFLVGAFMLRTARSAVVELVTGFEQHPLRAQLQPALRRALGDPGLCVLYPAEEGAGWVNEAGVLTAMPDSSARSMSTPILSGGRTVAVILHDTSLLEDPGLVSAIAATVRLAIDNEQLTLALEAQLAETRASRTRIVDAADAERQRIERDLHDGAQQRLVSLAISLRMLGDSLGDDASKEIRDELSAAEIELHGAIDELRALAHGLDPVILRESGLGPAVTALAARCPTPTSVELNLDGRLARLVEATAYFVVAEGLANVTKHAQARHVTIRLLAGSGRLLVEVEDDGRGGAQTTHGSGLRGLADRVAAAGGQFNVTSLPGAGTRLVADLPTAQ